MNITLCARVIVMKHNYSVRFAYAHCAILLAANIKTSVNTHVEAVP